MKLKIFLLFALVFTGQAMAGDPSAEEKKFFKELSSRYELHKDLTPLSVDQAIGTMKKTLEFSFDCPNPPPQKGRIKINTKLVAWNGQSGEAGHYDWKCSQEITPQEKLLECDNEISIDLSKMFPENNLAKQADNVRIYYHEWLHSQLLINAMQTTDWQKEFCKCNTDLSPADLEDPHKVIPTLDLPFMENLTSRIVNMADPWKPKKVPEFNLIGLIIALVVSGIFFVKNRR